MHISLDVLVEALEERGVARVEACAGEERLGISGVTDRPAQAGESTLLVVGADEAAALAQAPRHVLAVLAQDAPAPHIECPDLAVIRTELTAGEVCAEARDAMLALSNWDSRVLEAIAARQDVSAVLAIAAERLANPIALFDSKGGLISYAGSLTEGAERTIWEDVLRNRYSPIEFYTRDEQARIARDMRRPWPFVLSPARDPGHQYLSRGISIDGRLFGSIGMVDVAAPLTRGQVALAELVCDRLRLALSMRLGSRQAEDDTSYLLRSILNGNKADRGLVSHHIERLGWGQAPTFWLLTCETLESEGDPFADGTRLNRIVGLLRDALCMQYEGRVVALVANRDPSAREDLASLLGRLGMRAVVSAPFAAMLEARLAYEQCDLALRVTANQGRGGTVTPYPDLFEQALIGALDPSVDVRALCDRTILSLAERGYGGDLGRGQTLVRELHAYLMNGCNALLTARQLYLHRNTLLYHIAQVEELLGAPLADMAPSRRLALIVSCLVAEQG